MSDDRIELQSGVRAYAVRTWRHRWRERRLRRALRSVGVDLFVEDDVRILRHPERVTLGSHVILKEGARICPTNPAAAIAIGDRTTVGHHTFVYASRAITIGSDCLIAPFCYFVDSTHLFRRHTLIREQPMSASPIVIDDDVWFGVRATVLRGVHIGRGAVVGAGAVVADDVPEYAIVAGNPARVTGHRE